MSAPEPSLGSVQQTRLDMHTVELETWQFAQRWIVEEEEQGEDIPFSHSIAELRNYLR